jgi:hypothetical protein
MIFFIESLLFLSKTVIIVITKYRDMNKYYQ